VAVVEGGINSLCQARNSFAYEWNAMSHHFSREKKLNCRSSTFIRLRNEDNRYYSCAGVVFHLHTKRAWE
jgi:hypothetical protein